MQYEDIIRSIRVHLDEVTGCGGCNYTKGIPDATCFLNMIEDAANALETSEKNRMYLFDRVCELEEDNSELKELVPKWISVNERLPDSQRPVLVYVPESEGFCEYVGMADYTWSPKGGFWCGTDGETYGAIGFIRTPTHWCELPEPPKGE